MLNEDKLKTAFKSVKKDISTLKTSNDYLESQVKVLLESAKLSDDVKKQIEKLNKMQFEKVAAKLEKEFTSIEILVNDFHKKMSDQGKVMEKFSKQFVMYNKEMNDFKKRLLSTQNRSENNNLDIDLISQKFKAYQKVIDERVEVKVDTIKIQFTNEIGNLYGKFHEEIKKLREENAQLKARKKK